MTPDTFAEPPVTAVPVNVTDAPTDDDRLCARSGSVSTVRLRPANNTRAVGLDNRAPQDRIPRPDVKLRLPPTDNSAGVYVVELAELRDPLTLIRPATARPVPPSPTSPKLEPRSRIVSACAARLISRPADSTASPSA